MARKWFYINCRAFYEFWSLILFVCIRIVKSGISKIWIYIWGFWELTLKSWNFVPNPGMKRSFVDSLVTPTTNLLPYMRHVRNNKILSQSLVNSRLYLNSRFFHSREDKTTPHLATKYRGTQTSTTTVAAEMAGGVNSIVSSIRIIIWIISLVSLRLPSLVVKNRHPPTIIVKLKYTRLTSKMSSKVAILSQAQIIVQISCTFTICITIQSYCDN